MDRVKQIWYLSPMRAAKVQASLRIRTVSQEEPPLLAHTSSESRGTFRQKTRSLAPLNGWACAVEICHDGMVEDTNSFDASHLLFISNRKKTYRRFKNLKCNKSIITEKRYPKTSSSKIKTKTKSLVLNRLKFSDLPSE